MRPQRKHVRRYIRRALSLLFEPCRQFKTSDVTVGSSDAADEADSVGSGTRDQERGPVEGCNLSVSTSYSHYTKLLGVFPRGPSYLET
jgi:hypothetical protein